MNTEQSLGIRRRPTLGKTAWKRGAQFDDENSDDYKSKRQYLGYVAGEVLGCEKVRKEVWKPKAQFDNKVGNLLKSKRVPLSFMGRVGV